MRFSYVNACGVSAAIWSICVAQYRGFNFPGLPIDLHKLRQCDSRAEFCTSILMGNIPTTTVVETVQIAPKTHTVRGLTFKASFTSTITITVSSTATLTKGISTTTIPHCKQDATCGAVTFSHRDALFAACQSELVRTTTSTVTTHTTLAEIIVPKIRFTTKEIKTNLVTPTKTTTVAVATANTCLTAPPPENQCNNAGTRWAWYHIPPKLRRGTKLSHFNPTPFKTISPNFQNTTLEMGNIEGDYRGNIVLYDFTLVPSHSLYLNQVGYLYTPQTGEYSIRIPSVWNVAFFWIGPVAFSDWNLSNAFLRVDDAPPNPRATDARFPAGGGNRTIRLTAGSYVPFRIGFGVGTSEYEYDTNGWFYIEFRQPDGRFIEGTGAFNDYFPVNDYSHYDELFMRESPYVVQFSCDGTSAQPFPPFGSES